MLRILFSRLGQPHIGSAQAFSFNVASISGSGAVTIEKGGEKKREKRSFSITGGMCPRCEGMGSVTDFDLTQLYDDAKSLNEGALSVPRSEEHTSELQSLMRISYAVFCLKKKKQINHSVLRTHHNYKHK